MHKDKMEKRRETKRKIKFMSKRSYKKYEEQLTRQKISTNIKGNNLQEKYTEWSRGVMNIKEKC